MHVVLDKQVLTGLPAQPTLLGSGVCVGRGERLTEPVSSELAPCSVGLQFDIHTEVEKLEDPVHGVLDVRGVVFQAENEELFFIKDREPVQKVHGVQPDLQPHLGPKKAGVSSGVIPPTPKVLFQTHYTRHYKPTVKSRPSEQPPSEVGF